jgi:hypothetical protein
MRGGDTMSKLDKIKLAISVAELAVIIYDVFFK